METRDAPLKGAAVPLEGPYNFLKGGYRDSGGATAFAGDEKKIAAPAVISPRGRFAPSKGRPPAPGEPIARGEGRTPLTEVGSARGGTG